MTSNMYRVGDYVYFETSSTSPYQIRRIEELNKTPNGNVEAKVMCFFRRRDLPNTLIMLADKHQSEYHYIFSFCSVVCIMCYQNILFHSLYLMEKNLNE
ncbi:metastasis-associated protein MTA3-like [Homalodisca vitripennis]|uniref:metastasis-associated protein MTA3-like n=1 Tax=Homalodisca vitripennis TaxID=197043 RepID=UPI001EEB285E|nr:metastasis-associated protein MTA3-like [Homalodisca vitripennis]